MLDVSVAYNRYKFLGHEFLTWLWFMIDTDKEALMEGVTDLTDIYVGSRVVLENSSHNRDETITIKGDGAGFEEGVTALKKGAKVTEISLVATIGDGEWRFHLKGESLNISSLKPPETGRIESPDEMEGAVLEKIFLYEKTLVLVYALYGKFVRLRVSPHWQSKETGRMAAWIAAAA